LERWWSRASTRRFHISRCGISRRLHPEDPPTSFTRQNFRKASRVSSRQEAGMLSLIFLPVRLACALVFAVLLFPFHLVRFILKVVGTIVILPIVLFLAFAVLFVGGLALLVPFAVLGCFAWMLMRLFSHPARVAF